MKYIFRIIVCILLLLSFAAPLCIFADDADIDIEVFFDASNNLFVFSGHLKHASASPVTVCIKQNGNELPNFSPDSTPDIIEYFPINAQGVLSGSIPVSDTLPSGKYVAYFYYDTANNVRRICNKSFLFVSDADPETNSVIDSINLCTTATEISTLLQSGNNAEKLGIEKELADNYALDASEIILNQKKNSFTPKSFHNAAYSAFAACEIQSGKSVEECIKKYGLYFGTTHGEYISTTPEFREVLDTLLKKADYVSSSTADVYRDMFLTAEVKSTLSWDYLRTIVLSNFEPVSEYGRIPDNQKYMVFTAMFNERNGFNSPTDIQNSFDSNAKRIYNEINISRTPKSDSTSGSSISADKNVLNPSVITPSAAFHDISNHFCENAVTFLFENNIVNGYPDNTYKPDNYVTRAEFSKLITAAFKIELSYKSVSKIYKDVGENDWFEKYVYALSNNGIITGYNGFFNPNANITREDSALIMFRMLKSLNNINIGNYAFNDASDISDYATEAVESLANAGIVRGDGENFYPKSPLTRGEAAVIIFNTLNFTK